MGIPRGLAIALLIIFSTAVTALAGFNYFAPKFGLERDTIITALFSLYAGVILKYVLPSKKDDNNDGGSDVDRPNG